MLLYVHVPFCRSKCHYCAFVSESLGSDGESRLQDYAEILLSELRFWYSRLKQAEIPCDIETIFFGGGTPSLLDPAWIHRILGEVHLLFDVAEDAEVSMEANPDSFHTKQRAADFLAAGINRISLGVQTLDDDQLKVLGRVHHVSEAVQAVNAAREAGCMNLSLDLMWGLPGQTAEQWHNVLEQAVKLEPDHISAYGLTLEPGTPMASQGILLPSEEELAAMFMNCGAFLEDHGFRQYEISNYAREGFRCRHNLGYWEGKEYLGIGPAATSTIKKRRWTNASNISEWMRQVHEGRLSPEYELLDDEVRLLERLMLGLRTTDGFSLKLYNEGIRRDFLDDHSVFIQELFRRNLAVLTERRGEKRLVLTRQGMLLSNSVLETFFENIHRLLAH